MSIDWGFIGAQGVGKSCLVLRYVRGQFDPGSKVTIGAAFMSHTVSLASGASVKFEIWSAFQRLPIALNPKPMQAVWDSRKCNVGHPSLGNMALGLGAAG